MVYLESIPKKGAKVPLRIIEHEAIIQPSAKTLHHKAVFQFSYHSV